MCYLPPIFTGNALSRSRGILCPTLVNRQFLPKIDRKWRFWPKSPSFRVHLGYNVFICCSSFWSKLTKQTHKIASRHGLELTQIHWNDLQLSRLVKKSPNDRLNFDHYLRPRNVFGESPPIPMASTNAVSKAQYGLFGRTVLVCAFHSLIAWLIVVCCVVAHKISFWLL